MKLFLDFRLEDLISQLLEKNFRIYTNLRKRVNFLVGLIIYSNQVKDYLYIKPKLI